MSNEAKNPCAGCGAALDPDARFCPGCGRAVASRPAPTCLACGATLESDARFCPRCGALQDAAAAGAVTPLPVAGAGQDTGDAAPRSVQGLPLAVGVVLLVIVAVGAWSFLRSGGQPVGGAPAAPSLSQAPLPGEPAAGPVAQPAQPGPSKTPPAAAGAMGAMPGAPAMPAETGAGPAPAPGPEGAIVVPHGMGGEPGGMGGMGGMGGAMGGGAQPPPGGPAAGPIAGTIDLAPALRDRVKPGSVLFLIARPEGNGPPIAAAKIPLGTFPIPFEIGVQDLMGGQWGGPVVISVRLDQDGDARSKSPGDLSGEAVGGAVKPGDLQVKVLLDHVL